MGHHQVGQHVHNWSPSGRGEKGAERMFEKILAKNISYLMKYVNLPIQEALRTPGRINSERSTLRHIIVKLSKAKVTASFCFPTSSI